ncbi:IS256 family transposase [Corynebacterium diphtheriae]|nr:IS256 family transposase [Corynebacterium diphtheriae]CAB1007500.1 IS256 family transposase [Corynebacterium diphtheriae]CAB1009796.1 IS256 family transposase [Corynebacterium diphtheriae]
MSCVKLLATASNLLRKAGELPASAGRFVEGGEVSGWKQAINQMAVAYLDRFDKYH